MICRGALITWDNTKVGGRGRGGPGDACQINKTNGYKKEPTWRPALRTNTPSLPNRKRRMVGVGRGEEGWLGRDKAKRSREAER